MESLNGSVVTPVDNMSNHHINPPERRCENPDCNVVKLVSMVPKRKTTQFISEPMVMEKPMLVNGFTSVFQVDGSSAKLMDIKNPSGDSATKAIYRIVPNTHVHVVNYVVVDTDEAYLRKISKNDPATMQKLLASQKESADQMLKKLMTGQGNAGLVAPTTAPLVSTVNALPMQSSASSLTNVSTTPVTSGTVMPALNSNSSPIKLPVRMHPNLKITAVASAESVPTLTGIASSSVMTPAIPTSTVSPYITPVPLASLQNAAPSSGPKQPVQPIIAMPLSGPLSCVTSPVIADTVDKPVFDKMQAELQELRRTVTMLAEAQAKNQQQQQITTQRHAKRSRTISSKIVS
ncbi:uncharacterized protein LOC119637604 [Glossina fuscipes]|uniref:Uncharacterized protein LOC119637604 n=1 Tax=Glossina fuscipes TaxID=7396 RepID=A0A9C6DV65_9MUSC|nr:uncharacterized protein LOC119637604 [Glossina fuscipes]KAI9581820.1 hypothetical protein GQX74_010137 [Glossina fuscipes]